MSTFQPLSGDVTKTINPWTWITRGANGQLGDALEAVLEHMKTESWQGESKAAVDAFRFQLHEIQRLKAKRKAAVPV